MIVDDFHKYVFVSVPKTGSISMQVSLGYAHDIPEPEIYHAGISTIIQRFPHALEYFKFAFVRNPWARMLSLYKDFTLHRVHQYSEKVRHDQPLLGEFADFNDMCVKLHQSNWINDIFFRSQFQLLSIDGVLAMDFIGRFENIAPDFGIICQRINKQVSLIRTNVGKYESSDYRKYYNDAAREAIRTLYADDIESFGYEF